MKIKSTDSIYQVIEEALKGATTPQTCVDLMNNPVIRAAAMKRFNADLQTSTNKLSDTLGFMRRRGIVQRYPSSDPTSMARFSYALREQKDAEIKPIPAPARPSDKPVYRITEGTDSVTFDFEGFTLIVKKK